MKTRIGALALAAMAILAVTLISTGGAVNISEQLTRPANVVRFVARHCQGYYGNLDPAKLSESENTRIQKACGEDPTTVFFDRSVHNLRTNAGGDAESSQIGNTSTQAASCNYIALTNTAITPDVTHTTLSGEISSNGLSRAQATYTNTSHSQFTLTKTFTCATAPQAAQAEAVFNASSTGTECYEDTLSASASLQIGDTLAITHTINY